jgi:hypothetical protein
LRPDKEEQATALIEAIVDILWQAGELALARLALFTIFKSSRRLTRYIPM